MIQGSPRQPREGVVLLAVLIVLVLLALAAYQYSDLMTAEYRAADNYHRAVQARAYAESGVAYAAALLSNPESLTGILNDNPYDNEESFRNVAVGGDDTRGGRFTLIAPANPEDSTAGLVRNGVIDESGKINLNAMMKLDPSGKQLHDMLMKLPNMTEEIANSIIYWLDPARTPREGAAGDEYYSTADPPYRARGGPIDTIDELLLVQGVTPQLLYGSDLNRNGIQDVNEDEVFDRGWSAYLTVHSREQIIDATGLPLTNVNDNADDALTTLYEKLSPIVGERLAKFLVLYRQYGPTSSGSTTTSTVLFTQGGDLVVGFQVKTNPSPTPATVAGDLESFTPDPSVKAKTKVNSLFDLVNAEVSVPGKTQREPSTVYKSPLQDEALRRELLPKLFEAATVFAEIEIPARINVNTAAPEVLAAIPGLTETDVQAMLAVRPKLTSSDPLTAAFQTPAWLATEANLSVNTLRTLTKLITTRTQVYRVQVLGFSEDGQGPTARVEAIIDTNGGRPRIVSYRDMTDLGRGGATAR